MNKSFRFSFRISPVFAMAMFVSFVFAAYSDAAQAAPHRRSARRHVAKPAVSATQDGSTVGPTRPEVRPVADLEAFCARLKAEAAQPTQVDLAQCKDRLVRACAELNRLFDRDPNREAATYWRTTFKLSELSDTLAAATEPDEVVLQECWNAFQSDKVGVRWTVFDGVRKELRRYRTLRDVLKADNYEAQLGNVCDNLMKYIAEYSGNADPAYGTALADVLVWLEDLSVVEPRTATLAATVLDRLSGVNFRLFAGAEFVAAGFRTELNEEFGVDDTILGTRVTGTGRLTGTSDAELVPALGRAEIKVLIDSTLSTKTLGVQRPVILNTDSWGRMSAEKRIRITPEGFFTLPARSRAQLQSKIYNVRIDGGPIIQCIARNQIEERRGDSQREAARRAERRMDERVNERIDDRIASLNTDYQTKLRKPLLKAGLFPRIWDLSGTAEKVDWSILIGDATQPAAAQAPPEPQRAFDLFVQVHQSALNNAAAIALSGRAFDEEKVIGDLEKQFKELPKALQRQEGQKPIHVTFAQKGPIAVSFVDDRIKAVFRIDSFIQEGTNYPGLDVTLLYDVKTVAEKGEDGKDRVLVVLEQASAPQAFPRGFDPGSGQRISARHQAIRTIVLRRLEALPKRVEGAPRQLKGEWEGAGSLVPAFAASQDGWLTFAWDWVPTEN